MTNYDVTYKSEIITAAGQIRPDGFSCIFFENEGTADAVLNNNISLSAGKAPRVLENRPGEIIKSEFNISFGATGTKSILVVKTYYNEA